MCSLDDILNDEVSRSHTTLRFALAPSTFHRIFSSSPLRLLVPDGPCLLLLGALQSSSGQSGAPRPLSPFTEASDDEASVGASKRAVAPYDDGECHNTMPA